MFQAADIGGGGFGGGVEVEKKPGDVAGTGL